MATRGKEVSPLVGQQEPRDAGRRACIVEPGCVGGRTGRQRSPQLFLSTPLRAQDRSGGRTSMPAFVSPAVAVASAILAVASLLLYLHSTRRSDRDSAREEALALAETRGQLVAELRASLKLLEQRHKRMQT